LGKTEFSWGEWITADEDLRDNRDMARQAI